MHVFDWYSATLEDGNPQDFVQSLLDHNPNASYRPGKPLHGYSHGADVMLGDLRLSSTMWGGVNTGLHSYASSHEAIAFAAFMRSLFPSHTVSRADIAEDFSEPGCFDHLFRLLRSHADVNRLKTSVAGDWLGKAGGRTFYVGAPSSVVRLRLYEKGKQLGTDPNWVRLELVVRPANPDAKRWLAQAHPADCWGAARWTVKLAEDLNHAAPNRIQVGTVHRPSDDERAMHWLLKQYGPLLERAAAELGGWHLVGPLLQDRLAAIAAEAVARGQAPAPIDQSPAQSSLILT